MNDVLKTIMKRRSCRSFRAEPVPEELISRVVEAGLYAPNGGGRQDTLTLVVTDPEMIHCLARMNVNYVYGIPIRVMTRFTVPRS